VLEDPNNELLFCNNRISLEVKITKSLGGAFPSLARSECKRYLVYMITLKETVRSGVALHAVAFMEGSACLIGALRSPYG